MKTELNFPTKTFQITTYLILTMLLYCIDLSAQDHKNCCSSLYSMDTLKLVSLDVLSSEYHRLRMKKCEDCFYWTSGLQYVMAELGERLEGRSKATIRKVMGRPDEKKGNQWIYDWRDGHDYLFFEFTNGLAKANWYYALE